MGEGLGANMGLFDCSWVEKGGTIRSAGAVEMFWKDVCVISHQRICSEVAKKPAQDYNDNIRGCCSDGIVLNTIRDAAIVGTEIR